MGSQFNLDATKTIDHLPGITIARGLINVNYSQFVNMLYKFSVEKQNKTPNKNE